MKLTKWYSGDQKPVRIGVYVRNTVIGYLYSHWNGKFWGLSSDDPTEAEKAKHEESWCQDYPWCGVAK